MEDINSFNIHAASYADVLSIEKGERIVGFEVWPVALNRNENGETDSEPLSPEDIANGRVPDVYGVYARIGDPEYNLAQIVADCSTELAAHELVFMLEIAIAYSGGKLEWLVKPSCPYSRIPVAEPISIPAPVIGWTYDRYNNVVPVYAPVNQNLQPVYPSGNTMFGQIAQGVGLSGNKWDFDKREGSATRPSYKIIKNKRWAATEIKVHVEYNVKVVTETTEETQEYLS